MPNPVLMNGFASPVSIFETVSGTDNATHRVGTRGILDDRTFRWAKFLDGTAIGPNKLVQAAAPVAAHVSEATGAELTAGSTRLTMALGATASAENQYKDGYLKVEGGTNGIGQVFKLKGHAFVAASGTLTADIYEPVVTTTSGSEVLTLLANPYANVIIQPTTVTAPCVGVTMVNFAAASTASVATFGYEQTGTSTWTQPRYGWLQVGGLASVLLDTSALVAGHGVSISQITAGACAVAVENDIEQRIGVAMEAMGTDNIYASVLLQIL
jgi:hypothetical protein